MQKVLLFAIASMLALAACSYEPEGEHLEQPVRQRRAIFRRISQTLEQMGLVLRGRKAYDANEFSANAVELNRLASTPWEHFPPGSQYSPSHAKSEIWSEPETFKEMQQKLVTSTAQLVIAAQSQDMAFTLQSYDLVVKSCGICHNKFHRD